MKKLFILYFIINSMLVLSIFSEYSIPPDTSVSLEELLTDFDRCAYATYGEDPTSCAAIHWGTATETNSIVHYGLSPLCSLTKVIDSLTKNHHVQINSLVPNSLYYYMIEGRADTNTFRTAPVPSPNTSLSILAFGDNRTIHSDHQAVVNSMIKENEISFILNSGDLVGIGSSTEDWINFFNIESELLSKSAYFAAKGNHDVNWDSDDDPISLYFDVEEYGSFNYGNTHIIWLNSEVYITDFSVQAEWLESDLIAANDNPNILWKIAFVHKPPFSSGVHGSDISVRESFSPLFAQYGVDIVLSGHEHNYERSYSIGGTNYIISGGGGAPLRAVSPGATTASCRSLLHYCRIDVHGTDMMVLAKELDGTIFDILALHKGPHIITPNTALPYITRVTDNIPIRFESQITPSGIQLNLISKKDGLVYNMVCGTVESDSTNFYRTIGIASLEVPNGVYHLEITDDLGHKDLKKNAIHIVPFFSNEPSIVHISDPHYGSSIEHTNNLLHTLEITKMLNPDMVIMTGDLTEDGTRAQYSAILSLIEEIDIPLYLVPGSHDYYQWDGLTGYTDMISKETDHSFRYGNYHFLLFDSGHDNGFPFYQCYGLTEEQMNWAEEKLAENSDAYFSITAMHGAVFDEISPNIYNMDRFVSLCNEYNVKLSLSGHTHSDKVFNFEGNRASANSIPIDEPIFINTASCAKNDSIVPINNIRYIQINDRNIEYLTIDTSGTGTYADEESSNIWDFSITYSFNDDRTYMECSIVNDSYDDFVNCRIRPQMLAGHEYTVTGGTIVDTYDNLILDIEFDLVRTMENNLIVSTTGLYINDNFAFPDNYSLSAYPNPFNSSINIICSENLDLHILDMSGRLIKNLGRQRTWAPLDINPSGIYLIRDRTNNLTIPVSYIK